MMEGDGAKTERSRRWSFFNSQGGGTVFSSPSPPDRRRCGSGNNPSWNTAVCPRRQQIPHLEHGDGHFKNKSFSPTTLNHNRCQVSKRNKAFLLMAPAIKSC